MTDLKGLAGRVQALPAGRRLVALAGPPGAGKSTAADALARMLPSAAVLPMDGFHHDDAVLRERGLLPRKGAPETFDVGGLAHVLDRLRRAEEDEVAVPVFDRDLEVSRGSARIIPREVRVVVAEGNWLLLDRPPWDGLRARFDLTAWLEVGMAEVERRLCRRWEGYGLRGEAMVAKMEGDLRNARLATEASAPADVVLRPEG